MREANGANMRAVGVQAIDIGKSFGAFWALKNVSLDVDRGEFLTLLGPSGSGKTTFLMILAGFERATTGRLLSEGEDITAKSAESRSFGMVFQGYALFPHMTVAQNIAFPLKVRKVPRDVINRRVTEIIQRVGLGGQERKLPSKLSGGQQQRVALARALVFEPSVLLLDEPFSALDKHLRGRMQEEVKRLHKDFGTTFIFVTHDQIEALSLSSRIAIFNHGELLQISTRKMSTNARRTALSPSFSARSIFCRSRTSATAASEPAVRSRAPASPGHAKITPGRPELSRFGRSTCLSPTAVRTTPMASPPPWPKRRISAPRCG